MSMSKMANSELALPKYFKFDPTDPECMEILYLKVEGKPWSPKKIIDKDLFGLNAPLPWEAFTNGNYFWQRTDRDEKSGDTISTIFVYSKRIRCQARPNQFVKTAGPGPNPWTWQNNSKSKKILNPDTGEIMGERRTLNLKKLNPKVPSDWSMHGYSREGIDLVLCKIMKIDHKCSSMIANGGSSECIQVPANKRAAKVCPVQQSKVQKTYANGFAAEPPQFLPSHEVSSNGGISAMVAQYVEASKHDENIHGGDTAEKAVFTQEKLDNRGIQFGTNIGNSSSLPQATGEKFVIEDDCSIDMGSILDMFT